MIKVTNFCLIFLRDYNNEDFFVHASAIIKNNPNKYKASLSEGEPVEFDILKRADGKLRKCLKFQGSRYSSDISIKKNFLFL